MRWAFSIPAQLLSRSNWYRTDITFLAGRLHSFLKLLASKVLIHYYRGNLSSDQLIRGYFWILVSFPTSIHVVSCTFWKWFPSDLGMISRTLKSLSQFVTIWSYYSLISVIWGSDVASQTYRKRRKYSYRWVCLLINRYFSIYLVEEKALWEVTQVWHHQKNYCWDLGSANQVETGPCWSKYRWKLSVFRDEFLPKSKWDAHVLYSDNS